MTTKLTPRLVVSDAAKAITFYTEAFDATELSRYAEPGGAIVHAELSVGGVSFTLKDQDAADGAPAASGGTPVILQLTEEVEVALGRIVDTVRPFDVRCAGPGAARPSLLKQEQPAAGGPAGIAPIMATLPSRPCR